MLGSLAALELRRCGLSAAGAVIVVCAPAWMSTAQACSGGPLGMIPFGVRVFVASHPVGFISRKYSGAVSYATTVECFTQLAVRFPSITNIILLTRVGSLSNPLDDLSSLEAMTQIII
ncbi:hypothetical protein EAS61_41855 [Bradyrhizobium zhanjiangense]|uniref:Uncharacterized protein n=1 Tax=Bradyrhizobium zhanjiangense TaxID=1325107 RepID=A0A4Q0Q3R2_9BRAD|nr:hypothetical protein EAS61_41855 [Bradyrhizobium zhanjiangense]